MSIKSKMQKGFSLIELLIVIAIVAILTAIAIPMYTNYTAKAKLSEAYSFIGSDKTYVAEQINAKNIGNGEAITGIETAGGSKTGKYGSVANSDSGAITYTFDTNAGSQLDGLFVTMTPSVSSGAVVWTCSAVSGFVDNGLGDPCKSVD